MTCSKIYEAWKNLNRTGQLYIKKLLFFFIAYGVAGLLFHTFNHYLYNTNIKQTDAYLSFLIFPIFLLTTFTRWDKIKKIAPVKNDNRTAFWYALISIITLFTPLKKIIGSHAEIAPIIYFTAYFIINLFLFIALFGLAFFNAFIGEIILICSLYIIYLVLEVSLIFFWQYISWFIVKTLSVVLPLFLANNSFSLTDFNVTVHSFSVNIGPVCAGFYSTVAFTLLFSATLLLLKKYKKLYYGRALATWFIGVVILFFFNITRIIIILLVGAFWSKTIAINFFHEYLSALFLIMLFLIYLYRAAPLITQNKRSV